MRYFLTKQSLFLLGCALAIGACSMASSGASDRENRAQATEGEKPINLASAGSEAPPGFGPADAYGRRSSTIWLGDRLSIEDWVYEETSLSDEDKTTLEAHARFLEALLEGEGGNFKEAMASLDLARQARPEDEEIPLAIARLHLRSNNTEKAIEVAEEVLLDHPDSLEAHLILAESQFSRSQATGDADLMELAINHFEAARKLSPRDLRALIPLGQIYWNRFQRSSTPEMRRERGERVIGVYESVAESTHGRGKRVPFLVLASLYGIIGQRETAETYFTKAIEADRKR